MIEQTAIETGESGEILNFLTQKQICRKKGSKLETEKSANYQHERALVNLDVCSGDFVLARRSVKHRFTCFEGDLM